SLVVVFASHQPLTTNHSPLDDRRRPDPDDLDLLAPVEPVPDPPAGGGPGDVPEPDRADRRRPGGRGGARRRLRDGAIPEGRGGAGGAAGGRARPRRGGAGGAGADGRPAR